MSFNEFFAKKSGKIILIIFVILLIPLILFFALTLVDLNNPGKSYRLGLLWRLGLVRVGSPITNLVTPPQNSFSWEPTDIYWYPRDQVTLSGKEGYLCNLIGTIIEKNDTDWKVKAKNGQEFTLNIAGGDIVYNYFIPQYDEQSKKWNIPVESDPNVEGTIESGTLVLVKWACPVANPQDMVNNLQEMSVKSDYLQISPISISTLKNK